MSTALLLCTDMDRTLLPNGKQPESPQARQRFAELVAREEIRLAYVTGRDRRLVEQAMSNYRLPQPDFVVSDVGTNIYDLSDGEWRSREDWQAEIATDWNGYQSQELLALLAGLPFLRPQEHAKQNTYKTSFYVPLHADRHKLDFEASAILTQRGINASLVWSVDEPAGIGLLDVLPRSATKLHAVAFLLAKLGVAVEQCLFAGDSGNDYPVLVSSIPAVLVANAMPAVAAEAEAGAAAAGNRARLYLARGGLLGMNGNYSAGILEGVAHYHPQLAATAGLIEAGLF